MMKAVRFHGQRDIRLEEIEVPKCGKGQVKVDRSPRLGELVISDQTVQGETCVCRDLRD